MGEPQGIHPSSILEGLAFLSGMQEAKGGGMVAQARGK